jgi:hypothetical protein
MLYLQYTVKWYDDSEYIGNDLDRNDHGAIEVGLLSRHLSGETEEKKKNWIRWSSSRNLNRAPPKYKSWIHIYRILGSHSSGYKDFYLLG